MKKIQLTKQGFHKIKAEHEEMKKNKHPKAITRLQTARAMGDLSENSEYTAAKEDLAFVEGRIQELENILNNAELIEELENNSGIVELGSTVIVSHAVDHSHNEYMIVGEFEADPQKKKLSHTSPMGSALIGKKKGQKVKIKLTAGEIEYIIVDIKK